MVKIDDGVIWPKPFLDFLSGYNLPAAFNEHSQNLIWLLPKRGFLVLADCSCGVERPRTEIDLEGSEPNTTCALTLNSHLHPWPHAPVRPPPPPTTHTMPG